MEKKISKEMLKKALRQATGCTMQHDGWSCGTCFFNMSAKEDFNNSDWQAVLLIRGDYKKEDLDNLPIDIDATIDRIYKIAMTE